MLTYRNSSKHFLAFFGKNNVLSDLTKEKMIEWKANVLSSVPAVATATGIVSRAKTVFNWAVRQGWIEQSPLKGIGAGSYVNKEKDYFISIEDYYRLLDACRSPDWRAIIALVRIGGLRAPSEVIQSLRWCDINLDADCFQVKCKKTKRYAGKELRMVSLFPELRRVLKELHDLRSPNEDDPVILQYTDPKVNLGTEFGRIRQRSGVEPFSRPFDNMRASRSIEVYQFFGEWEESQWIGHSRATARKHYLQMLPQHFTEAANWETPVDWSNAKKSNITPNRDMDSEERFLR